MTIPKWEWQDLRRSYNDTLGYKYFIKGHMDYELYKFLLEDDEEAISANKKFCEVILLFNSKTEQKEFNEYVLVREEYLIYSLEQSKGNYS
ncbi:hypothetical protein CJ195_16515 [Bacillus sp. UMB0899]|nr:hypothetical protein CJ195_16515 [Bacillus sp. UMB0899]